MARISENIKTLIIDRMLYGKSQRQVARELNMSQSSVNMIWKRYCKTGSTDIHHGTGRPLKTTTGEREIICNLSHLHPFSTVNDLMTKMKFKQNISIRSIRRVLSNQAIYKSNEFEKSFINKKRLLWCHAYCNLKEKDWNPVLFSGVLQLNISTNHSVKSSDVSILKENNSQNIHNGKFSISVWGAIKSDGKHVLVRCPLHMDSEKYKMVLEEGLLQLIDKDSILIQDCSPYHKFESTYAYLEKHGICTLNDWPENTRGINIIDDLFSMLKEKVTKRNAINVEELWSYAIEEWTSIPLNCIQSLYKSFSERLRNIIKQQESQLE